MRLTETADTSSPAWPPNADPCIVATHGQWRGRSIELVGKRLKEVAGRLKRRRPRRRSRGGVQASRVWRHPPQPLGDVCAWLRCDCPRAAKYRFYLTNIDPESLDAHSVAQTYAARWQIELIFKELKSHYRLDELPTRKAAYLSRPCCSGPSSRCSSVAGCSRPCRNRLRRTSYKMPEQRWAAIFAAGRASDPRYRSVAAEGIEGDCTAPRIDVAPRGAGPESVAATAHRTRRTWCRVEMTLCNSTR